MRIRRKPGLGGEQARDAILSVAGRVAAVAAVAVAIVVVAVLLFAGGSGGYTVKADFINASTLVKGNLVEIGGQEVGTVDNIAITQVGQQRVMTWYDAAYHLLNSGDRVTT